MNQVIPARNPVPAYSSRAPSLPLLRRHRFVPPTLHPFPNLRRDPLLLRPSRRTPPANGWSVADGVQPRPPNVVCGCNALANLLLKVSRSNKSRQAYDCAAWTNEKSKREPQQSAGKVKGIDFLTFQQSYQEIDPEERNS